MTDDTVLVVDAGQETEDTIVSTLESAGYLVFTASGLDVSASLASKISPSLIYLKPAALGVEGFATCKAIHNTEKFRHVPIVLLASLKGPLDSRYTNFYGVVDYLNTPVSSKELLEKTEKILGTGLHDLQFPEEDMLSVKKEPVIQKEPELEEKISFGMDMQDEYADDIPLEEGSEVPQSDEEHTYSKKLENIKASLYENNKRANKKSELLMPIVVVTAVLAIAAAGYILYNFLLSPSKIKVPVAVQSTIAVQPQEAKDISPKKEQEQSFAHSSSTVAMPQTADITQPQTSVQTPVVATKPGIKKVYSVQLGAFKSEVTAAALAKIYNEKGYKAYVYKGNVKNKGIFYRVLIGEFADKKEALQLSAKIKTTDKIDTIVFSGE